MNRTIAITGALACALAASVAVWVVSCSSQPPPASTTNATASVSTRPAPNASATPADAPAYEIKTEADACTHGVDCEFRIRVSALGEYHLNPDYPHRFVSPSDAGLQFTALREFARDGEKHGTLTVRYRVPNSGAQKIAGTFKLAVCNADICKIEEAPIAFDVAVQ